MSVILQFSTALEAHWDAKGYASTPLLYGYGEVSRTKDLDAVALGHGRIVYHAGAWPGPESNAGQMSNEHAHAFRSARAFGSDAVLWTVHIHGFDPAFPDRAAPGAERAQDNRCWALKEMFFGAAKHVQIAGSWKGFQYLSETWVRDPAERRFGELLRCEFSFTVSMREAPEVPIEYPTTEPRGSVIAPSGEEITVVEVA